MADSWFGRLFTGLKMPRARPFDEMGVSGTAVQGGYVAVQERSPEWTGLNRYVTSAEIAVNVSIVAASVRYFLNLVAHPTWTVRAADDNNREAVEKAELVDNILRTMDTPWTAVVRKAAMYQFHGFGVQEWIAKRRDDGVIGYRDVEPRPQHTIEQWSVTEDGTIEGVYQRSPQTGMLLPIPRKKMVYMVDDSLSDSPEGLGVFRHLAEPYNRLKQYLKLEARGFERDLRGTPIGRVPYTKINQMVKKGQLTEPEARRLTEGLERFVRTEVRKSDTSITLDSQPYESPSADGFPKLSATPMWGVELLSGGVAGLGEVSAAIDRIQREMARITGTEALMMGDAGGNRALAVDKSRNLYLVANAVLGTIASSFDRDLLTPLWLLNGWDAETKPTLETEDVTFKDVDQVTGALSRMAQAGAVLAPNDPAINDVRDLLGLQHAPEQYEAEGALPPENLGENEEGALDEAAKRLWKGADLKKYDPSQPRDEGGRWTTGGSVPGYSAEARMLDGKLYTSNVEDAVKALYAGQEVVLDQPRTVSTLLNRLAEITRDAEAKGEKAGNYDLCKVSVPGTNLFCSESKGIPRVEMPQLKGVPAEGSRAAAFEPDSRGEVDLSSQFMEHMRNKGYAIQETTELATYLKASQNELNGVKVAGIANAIRENKLDEASLFVSRDNYIVDGHHRWAATVGVDLDDGRPGDLSMPVSRIDTDIITILSEANTFAAEWGIPQAGFGTFGQSKKRGMEILMPIGDRALAVDDVGNLHVVDKGFDPSQPRDEGGKWSTSGAGGTGAGTFSAPEPSSESLAASAAEFVRSQSVVDIFKDVGMSAAIVAPVFGAALSGLGGAEGTGMAVAAASWLTLKLTVSTFANAKAAKTAIQSAVGRMIKLREAEPKKAEDELLAALRALQGGLAEMNLREVSRQAKAINKAIEHFQRTGEPVVVVGVED